MINHSKRCCEIATEEPDLVDEVYDDSGILAEDLPVFVALSSSVRWRDAWNGNLPRVRHSRGRAHVIIRSTISSGPRNVRGLA